MAQEITFGYITGATLTYAVYQPDGTIRTAAGTALPEVAGTGYYKATNASITAGDFVIVRQGTLEVGQGQYLPKFDTSVLEALLYPSSYISFDGSTGYVSVPNNAALNVGTGDFSISLWVKDIFTNVLTDAIVVVSKGDSNGYSIYYQSDTQKLGLGTLASGTLSEATIDVAINTQGWRHIVFTRDGNAVTAYLNGTSQTVTGTADANDLDNSESFYLAGSALPIIGSLDDFRLYKKVLSASEVSSIYNGGAGTKYTGAVLEGGTAAVAFNMDECYGLTITDTVSALEGTLVGGITWHKGGTKFDIFVKELVPYVNRPILPNIYDMTKI